MPRIYRNEVFKYGVVDKVEEKSIPPGSASRAKNWLTMGDHIELRRGSLVLGSDGAVGKITGGWIGYDIVGNEVPFRKVGRKLEYYDVDTSDWVEVGTNIFPVAAEDEDVLFSNVNSLAGSQVWCGSPNSGLYKIMVNGGKSSTVAPSVKDNYSDSKNHKGYIRIYKSRIFLWQKKENPSGLYGSFIDSQIYTTVSNENVGSVGDGSNKDFTDVLAAVTGTRTCFAIVADAQVVGGATETFTDNGDGTLTSNLGGTGTINYSTGDIVLHFNTAPDTGQNVLADYQWEDSLNKGIADFTESGTRVAGEGFFLPQGDGGKLMSVEVNDSKFYCIHEFKTWVVNLTNDDTNATNEIFREKVGIPSIKGARATGDGIYYIDDRNEADVKVRLLSIPYGSTEVVPSPKSNNLDLSPYKFDKSVLDEYGDFILVACRTKNSIDSQNNGVNNIVLIYNKLWKSWDVTDYFATSFITYGGVCHACDSTKNNVYEIFSGFDDFDSGIDNFYDTNLDEMQIRELKKEKSIRIEGNIQDDQLLEVWAATDNGSYVKLGEILGTGSYVDKGQSVTIGGKSIGKLPIGGGNSSENIVAYHYLKEISIRRLLDKFQRISLRFTATQLGYVSVSSYEHHDITLHGDRIQRKYKE
jgi:hypothetical protein